MSAADVAAVPVHEGLLSLDPPSLLGSRCLSCGDLRFPQRGFCAACQQDTTEPVALSTTGTVYTFTIVRMAPPGYSGPTPYAIGVVELPEGLRVTTTLVAQELESIAIGAEARFEPLVLGEGDDAVLSYSYRVETSA